MLEGIRNTTKTSSESRKVANHVRLRRMTYVTAITLKTCTTAKGKPNASATHRYGPRPCIRVYNEVDATAAHVLREIHHIVNKDLYLDHVELERCVMFATTGELICVNLNGELKWNVKWNFVLDFEEDGKILMVKVNVAVQKGKKSLKKRRRKKEVLKIKRVQCHEVKSCKETKERLLRAREMAMLYVSLK